MKEFLLKEDDDEILLETTGSILLESSTVVDADVLLSAGKEKLKLRAPRERMTLHANRIH